ncbi:hypothetical protein [Azospirillum himalayense]
MDTVADQVEAGALTNAEIARSIREWKRELHRRQPVQRTPPRRRGGGAAADIISYHAAHPNESYHEIAEACGTTIGRVSETLAGKRT